MGTPKFNIDKVVPSSEQRTGNAPKPVFSLLSANTLIPPTDTQNLPIGLLDKYRNHHFKPYTEDALRELASSIERDGLLSPLVVRSKDERYEILAGHNRKAACELLGWATIPCKVINCDDDTADLIVTSTNLCQRQQLFPSEKAWAYKMQLDALKRAAGRPKENGGRIDHRFNGVKSRDILAEQSTDSAKQIQRFIRLTNLIPPLLNLVDTGRIPVNAGVELSFLPSDSQQILLDFLHDEMSAKTRISLKDAKWLREQEDLTEEVVCIYFFPPFTEEEQNEPPAESDEQEFTIQYHTQMVTRQVSDLLDALRNAGNIGMAAQVSKLLDELKKMVIE